MGNLRFSGDYAPLAYINFTIVSAWFPEHFPARCGRMGTIMLIEIWERLRGYNKWIQTEAQFESSKVEESKQFGAYRQQDGSTWASDDVLVWTDRQGQRHGVEFQVPDDSPLYQFVDGETVTIRYNPAKPDQFYLRELLRTRVRTAFKTTFLVLLLVWAFLHYFNLIKAFL
jgi:hypothetical protein